MNANPCFLDAVGVMICTQFDGLTSFDNMDITKDIWELEMKRMNEQYSSSDRISYDLERWPILQNLWVNSAMYQCAYGLCERFKATRPTSPSISDEDNDGIIVTDVGVLLITLIGLIIIIVMSFLCKKNARKCLTWIRRNITRGGVTLDNPDDLELNSRRRDDSGVTTHRMSDIRQCPDAPQRLNSGNPKSYDLGGSYTRGENFLPKFNSTPLHNVEKTDEEDKNLKPEASGNRYGSPFLDEYSKIRTNKFIALYDSNATVKTAHLTDKLSGDNPLTISKELADNNHDDSAAHLSAELPADYIDGDNPLTIPKDLADNNHDDSAAQLSDKLPADDNATNVVSPILMEPYLLDEQCTKTISVSDEIESIVNTDTLKKFADFLQLPLNLHAEGCGDDRNRPIASGSSTGSELALPTQWKKEIFANIEANRNETIYKFTLSISEPRISKSD
jgi:hypothetical protein